MNDFDYDVMQKKRIAYGAFHKKNGSKSKKCTMPSDYLSKQELKKLYGGKTMTYNLAQPMEWKAFKKMPNDLQTEYLNSLSDKYNASMNAIAGMFGITYAGLKSHMDVHHVTLDSHKIRIMSRKQLDNWEKFVNGENKKSEPKEEIKEEATAPTQEIAVQSVESELVSSQSEQNPMRMSKVTLTFHGIIKPMDIANTLSYMFGDNTDGELKIEFLAGKKGLDDDPFPWN